MGRGEIPVELLAGSHPFFASFVFYYTQMKGDYYARS